MASKKNLKPDLAEPALSRSHIMRRKIVCVGTSTGGPRSLEQMLPEFPERLKAPVLVVQHMPAKFTKSLAERLNRVCSISVKEAVDGEIIQDGVVYIAPGDYHLKVRNTKTALVVELNESEPRNGHRPSVDTLFESVAKLDGYLKIAVILTGMGSDGANGVKIIKANGPSIAIAESEQSAVIYGMPKAAAQTRRLDYILHLKDIGKFVVDYIETR